MGLLIEDNQLDKPEGHLTGSKTPVWPGKTERRGKKRVFESFPIRIRGLDSSGEAFEIDTVLDNISASGLYVRLTKQLTKRAKLFMVIRLTGAPENVSGARIAVRGEVERLEPFSAGYCGVGVRFISFRFLENKGHTESLSKPAQV